LSYQWSKNGAPIAGASDASYTQASVSLSDDGAQFAVTATNGAGSITSVVANLRVTQAVVLDLQPVASVTIAPFAGNTWSVHAVGSGPIWYQWMRSGVPIPGATQSSYANGSLGLADDGADFTVKVSNPLGSVVSSASRLTVTPSSVAQQISACQEITQPGWYQLATNLQNNSPSNACINIHDTQSVLLDCAGNSIVNADTSQASMALSLTNTSHISVRHCSLQANWTSFQNASDISFNNNYVLAQGGQFSSILDIDTIVRLLFARNSLQGSLQQQYGQDSVIAANQIHSVSGQIVAGAMVLNYGTGSQVINNQINGGWDPVAMTDIGADDGIIVSDEAGLNISGNTITNAWDAGIEWTGNLNGAIIQDNTISNVRIGIGGWYYSNVSGSQFIANTVSQAETMFYQARTYCLRPAGWDLKHLMPADTDVLWNNNLYSGNQFIQPVLQQNPYSNASMFNFAFAFGNPAVCSSDPGETLPTPSDFQMSNNVFINNDFGVALAAPAFFSVGSAVIDGGGNVCSPPSSSAPGNYLNCQPGH
jgi:parallel beta-helix repeat protein